MAGVTYEKDRHMTPRTQNAALNPYGKLPAQSLGLDDCVSNGAHHKPSVQVGTRHQIGEASGGLGTYQ